MIVNAGAASANEALISKATGRVCHRGYDIDDVEEFSDDIDGDGHIALPHRPALDLDSRLVDKFAEEILPQHANEIRDIFSDAVAPAPASRPGEIILTNGRDCG